VATILIVDDQFINRNFLMTLLGYDGHRLLEAAEGAEALELARTERPDLVIADVLMPNIDGYEFVRRLRSEPAIADTPVIFYTATYHEHEAQALARACGISHILTKPAEPETVLSIVSSVLTSKTHPATVVVPSDFDNEHLRLVTDKLHKKVKQLIAVQNRPMTPAI